MCETKFALAYHMPKINIWIIVNRDMMNRADKLKSEVKALLTGLPAADAQYHKSVMMTFCAFHNIQMCPYNLQRLMMKH